MNVEVIGTWAGQVWNALNESGKLTVKGLKKATKLKEKEIYAALGWLAREGKVSISETEADVEVVLLYSSRNTGSYKSRAREFSRALGCCLTGALE